MRKTRRDKIHAEMQGYTDRQKARVAARARGVRHLELIHAIEERKVKTIADAIAFAYQQEGHVFYVLTFPTGDATWVLDLTTTEKIGYPVWHQRAAFGNGVFSRWWANALMDPSWGVGPQGQG